MPIFPKNLIKDSHLDECERIKDSGKCVREEMEKFKNVQMVVMIFIMTFLGCVVLIIILAVVWKKHLLYKLDMVLAKCYYHQLFRR